MVVSVKFKIKGLKELDRYLKSADRKIRTQVNKAIKRVAWILTREVKKGTPVDTGRLRRSIQPIFKDMFAEIFSNVDYVLYVEEGTRKMKAANMFLNVVDKYEREVPQMVLDEIKKSI